MPIVLVATKLDLRVGEQAKTLVAFDEGKETQAKHNFYSLVECSAKNMDNF